VKQLTRFTVAERVLDDAQTSHYLNFAPNRETIDTFYNSKKDFR